MSDAPDARRFARLPEPVAFGDLRTSQDPEPVHEEKDDYWREVEWMLRTSGGV